MEGGREGAVVMSVRGRSTAADTIAVPWLSRPVQRVFFSGFEGMSPGSKLCALMMSCVEELKPAWIALPPSGIVWLVFDRLARMEVRVALFLGLLVGLAEAGVGLRHPVDAAW